MTPDRWNTYIDGITSSNRLNNPKYGNNKKEYPEKVFLLSEATFANILKSFLRLIFLKINFSRTIYLITSRKNTMIIIVSIA